MTNINRRSLFTVGGTVQAGEGLYIERQADQDLLDLCRTGTFAYVLTARQMGKSSLMVRTAQHLSEEGIRSVILDLTELGVQATAEAWYLGMLFRISTRLDLSIDFVGWWQAHPNLGPTQRLVLFFQEIVLAAVPGQIVFFLDEIDTTLGLEYTDDFFTAIRYLYNARALDPELRRLSFVLIGVATPTELIGDPKRTPFNIGQQVDLTDFTFAEAEILTQGLLLPADESQKVLGWVLKWTEGHPYLTQRLCAEVAWLGLRSWSESDVDQVVANTFFGEMSERDDNLQFVHDMLTKRFPDWTSVLLTYREILTGRQPVLDSDQSMVKAHLKLSGVVRREGKALRVRNPIYAQVFDIRWVREQWPVNWWQILPKQVKIASGVIALLFIALVFTSIFALRGQQHILQLANARATAEAVAQQNEQLAETREAEAVAAQKIAVAAQAEAVASLKDAEDERNQAEKQAQINLSRLLANHALNFAGSQLDLALLLSMEGRRIARTTGVQDRANLLAVLGTSPRIAKYLHTDKSFYSGLALHPNGQTLATVSESLQYWDLRSGQPMSELIKLGAADVVSDVVSMEDFAFSPDFTAVNDAGEPAQVVPQVGLIEDFAFSPDFTALTLVKMYQDFSLNPLSGFLPEDYQSWYPGYHIRVDFWDHLDTEPRLKQTINPSSFVSTVAIHPNGNLLAIGKMDGSILLWEVENNQPVGAPLHGNGSPVSYIVFSPDGNLLASTSYDDGTIILWDLESNQERLEFLHHHKNYVSNLVFSPNGKVLASTGPDESIRFWDIATGYPIGDPLIGDFVWRTNLAFSPDGKMFATVSADRTIILWNVATSQVSQNSDSSFTLKRIATLAGHSSDIRDIAFSRDGKILVSIDSNGKMTIWKAEPQQRSGELLRTSTDGAVYSIAFSPDGRLLASSGDNGEVILWDMDSRPLLGQPLQGHQGNVWSVAFNSDGSILATGGQDKTILLWNTTLIQRIGALTGHKDDVLNLAINPNQSNLASGSKDGEVIIWDLRTLRRRSTWSYHPPSPIQNLAISPDGNLLAVIWNSFPDISLGPNFDVDSNDFTFILPSRITTLAFHPDSRQIAFGDENGNIYFGVMFTRQPLGLPLAGHTGRVTSVAFSPDGTILASGGEDRSVILWDVSRQQPLGLPLTGHTDSVTNLVFDPIGDILASAGLDGTIRLWDTGSDELIRQACQIANRNLTQGEWEQFIGREIAYEKTCPDLPEEE